VCDGDTVTSLPQFDTPVTWASLGAEEAVRALRSAPVSILFLRPDLTIVDATDRYLADTSRERAEVVGRRLFDAFPGNPDMASGGDGVHALRSSLDRVRATRRPDVMPVQRYDIHLPGSGFEERHWAPVNTPVLDDAGEIVLIHHQVTDVTDVVRLNSRLEHAEADRQRIEEHVWQAEREILDRSLELHRTTAALRTSEERFRLVCEATSDTLWDWDATSNRLWWSDSLERTCGYRPSDLAHLSDSWTFLLHPDDRDAAVASLWAAIHGGGRSWEHEYRLLHRDGHPVWVRDHAMILRDEDGTAYRLIGGIVDVTERRAVEEQYRRAQRLETVGLVAGGIAHDLNNVLAPVLMGAELLALDEADPTRKELLGMVVSSAQRGAAMVRQVLTFARGVDVGTAPVAIADLVREAARLVRRTLPPGVRVDLVEPDAATSDVPGDVTRLHQVLANLCDNAREAMPAGGTLTIRWDELAVDESFAAMHTGARPGRYVRVTVADTGVGMDADTLERIWEPYFTTKGAQRGTGLGLPSCATIVRDHGGFIGVRSAPAVGSTFEVYLPVEVPVGGEADQPIESPRGDGITVLLIDDEESILEISRAALEFQGYRVVAVSNGIEAVAFAATSGEHIDVVVVDMALPEFDGHSTITALAHLRPELAFVAVSSGGPHDALRREPAAARLLAKPYTAVTLLRTVADAIAADRPA
jgi:PAS domain S-box-containing protein